MTDSTKPKLTVRELEIAGLVWQCFEGEPKVNYKKLAEISGLKDAKSANTTWAPIKRKLMAQAGGQMAHTPKSGSRKRSDEGDDDATPTKKRRTKAVVKKASKEPNMDNASANSADDIDVEIQRQFKLEEEAVGNLYEGLGYNGLGYDGLGYNGEI